MAREYTLRVFITGSKRYFCLQMIRVSSNRHLAVLALVSRAIYVEGRRGRMRRATRLRCRRSSAGSGGRKALGQPSSKYVSVSVQERIWQRKDRNGLRL